MMALDDQQRMLRYRENNLSPSNVLYPEEDWYSQYGMPAPIEGTPPDLDRRKMLEEMNAPPDRSISRAAPPPLISTVKTGRETGFDTRLNPTEESQFQTWKSRYASQDSGMDYDLRGAFKAGLKPGPDGHWPDTFKKPNHPTFSVESIYAKNAQERAGRWEDGRYVAAAAPPPLDPEADIADSGSGGSSVTRTAPPMEGGAPPKFDYSDLDRRLEEYNRIKSEGPPKPSWWRYPTATAVGAVAGPHAARAVLYPGYDRKVTAADEAVKGATARVKAEQEGYKAETYGRAQGELANTRRAQGAAARNITLSRGQRAYDSGGRQIAENPDEVKQPTTTEAAMTSIRLNPQYDNETKEKMIEELAGDYNKIHNTSMAPHYVTDKDGNVTAVLLESRRAGGSYSSTGLGKIGPPRREPQGPAGTMESGKYTKEGLARLNTIVDNARVDKNVTMFPEVRSAYETVVAGAAEGHKGVGDLTLLRMFAKILDPTAVREEEYRSMQSALGELARMGVKVSSGWFTGEQLTDDGRSAFVRMAKEAYRIKLKLYNSTAGRARDLAVKSGVDPDDVFPIIDDPDVGGPTKPPPAGSLGAQQGKTVTKSKVMGIAQSDFGGDYNKAAAAAKAEGYTIVE